MLRVAVDFGTSSTCAAVSADATAGRAPQIVVVDGAPLMPSAVYVTSDGTLFVGQEAERQAALDPSRYEPHPKRRIDEPELLLGDTVLPVVGVVRAVLRRALLEARHLAGGATADQLVLTHPADWGAARTQKLRRAAHALAAEVVLVPEPVAAAVFHSQNHAVPDGGCLAVLDLGGGTVDASVVRRTGPTGFQVLATRGDPHFGGADIDQALLEHVGAQVSPGDPEAWRRLVEGRELADRRRRRVLRQDVRGAKETLSRHTFADVPMPPPFPDAHVTRADLEALIGVAMQRTVALLAATIGDAGLRPDELVGVFLVGGSSRIPMVSRLVHERLGVVPVTLDQPETVVARGALSTVMADPERTATVPPSVFTLPGTPLPGQAGPPPGVPLPVPASPGPGGPGLSGPGPGGPGFSGSGRGAAGGPAPTGSPGPGPGLSGPGPAGPAVPVARPVAAPPSLPTPGAAQQSYPAKAGMASYPDRQASIGPPRQAAGPRTVSRAAWLVIGAVPVAAAVLAVVLVLALGGAGTGPTGPSQTPTAVAEQVAEYHYRFAVPNGWRRSGGNEDQRQVDVAPTNTDSTAPDRIFVKENELSYDAEVDRDRAVAELRSAYDSKRTTTPPTLNGFEPEASYAGRPVLRYTETARAGTVDWFVLFGGRFQVSIGCQYDQSRAQRVQDACMDVVRTLAVQS